MYFDDLPFPGFHILHQVEVLPYGAVIHNGFCMVILHIVFRPVSYTHLDVYKRQGMIAVIIGFVVVEVVSFRNIAKEA